MLQKQEEVSKDIKDIISCDVCICVCVHACTHTHTILDCVSDSSLIRSPNPMEDTHPPTQVILPNYKWPDE